MDVQRLEEACVGGAFVCQIGADALGDLAVQPSEADNAVGGLRRRLDRPEATDHLGNALRHYRIFAAR